MKKLLCCILAVVVCIGVFAGCGEKENDAPVLQPNDTDFGVTAKGVLDALNGQIDSNHAKFDSLGPVKKDASSTLLHFESKASSLARLLISSDCDTKQAKQISLYAYRDDSYAYYCKALFSSVGFSKDEIKSLVDELELENSPPYDRKTAEKNGIQIVSLDHNLDLYLKQDSESDSQATLKNNSESSSSKRVSSKPASSSESSEASSKATSPSSSQTTSSKAPAAKTYKAGMYKVGSDLPAGEYLLKSTNSGYMSVASDSSGTLDSIITNEVFDNTLYVTVSEGQYLTVERATFVAADEAPAQQPANGKYSEGMYKVGKDIAPGEYKVHSDEMGYLAVLTNSVGDLDSIVTNDNFEGDKYITLQDGQYLKLSRAYLIA